MRRFRWVNRLSAGFCLAVFLCSMVVPAAVSADDGLPPQPVAEATSLPGTDSDPVDTTTPEPEIDPTQPPVVESPTDAPSEEPTQTPAPSTDPAPVMQEPPAESETDLPSEPQTPAEVLADLPEGVDLVVNDASGQPVSIISSEAEEIVALPDPWYVCVGSTSHSGTHNFTSINAAIADMSNCTADGGHVDGALTIEAGTFDEAVVYDGVINGFTSIVGAGSGQTNVRSIELIHQINMALSGMNIANYVHLTGASGDLALSDITINNSTTGGNIIVQNDSEDGTISLTNVVVDGSTDGSGYGVSGSGIHVSGGERATLTNVQSLHNQTGVNLIVLNHAQIGTTAGGVSAFDHNQSNGITANYIPGAPGLSISNTSISGNGQDGFLGEDLTGGLTLNNVKINENGVFGLSVSNVGDVQLSQVVASDNEKMNFDIENFNSVDFTNVTSLNAHSLGILLANGGPVYMNGVNFSYNGLEDYSPGAMIAGTTGDILVKNSTFNGNGFGGLFVQIHVGDIKIMNSRMDNNLGVDYYDEGIIGAGGLTSLLNIGDISISNSTFNNNLLGIYTMDTVMGDITLENATMQGNQFGLVVENEFFTLTKSDPFVPGTSPDVNIICSKISNNGGGVALTGVGNVTITGLTIKDNQNYDIQIKNMTGQYSELSGCKVVKKHHTGKIVSVTGGEQVPLECNYLWTKLVVDSGDWARFEGLCGLNAAFVSIPSASLPGPLPAGTTYQSGFGATVANRQAAVIPDGGYANLSLVQPAGVDAKTLVVLFWDAGAGKWIELPAAGNEASFTASNPAMKVLSGVKIGADGNISFSVNFTGTFILAAR